MTSNSVYRVQALDRSQVIQNERRWHEEEAHRRKALDHFLYDPPAFDSIVQSAFEFLQLEAGELVLDLGCGEGKESALLAARGLRVISIDLSHAQLSEARELVSMDQAQVYLVQANAEALPFAKDSFRVIHGKAILHHLDPELTFSEINRTLRARGRVTFAEPMAYHPLFYLFRRLTPHLRTKDERPIMLDELHAFARRFAQAELETYFLLAPLAYLFRLLPKSEGIFRTTHRFLHGLDHILFRAFPVLRHVAWYGLIKLQR